MCWYFASSDSPYVPLPRSLRRSSNSDEEAAIYGCRHCGHANSPSIASGINRLAKRLAESHESRADLTARLIRVQEDERRELAHELHEEFGQCVSALSAVSASLRHSVTAGSRLTEADMWPLETATEQMLSSLRGLLQRMSLPPLEQQGLCSALADLVSAWQIRLLDSPRIELDADPKSDRAGEQ